MNENTPRSYREAGVDTHAGRSFVKRISAAVKSTHNERVLAAQAGFGGLMDVSFLKEYRQPVLVSSTDGVGTKLHLARLFDRHETVGIDLVAMCVNDLLATGAKALSFMDYIACGRLDQERMSAIVESIAEGCRQAECALVGGETAEHPDTMAPDEYDLAGFAVGVVERDRMLDAARVQPGDVILSLPSSGVHSNGLSLVRKLFLKDGLHLPEDAGEREFLLNEVLLQPTIIYEPFLRPVLESYPVRAVAHITGGGFYENIPRVLPAGLAARVDKQAAAIPDVFTRIQAKGRIEEREMYSVYNMGVGMIVIVPPEAADGALALLEKSLAARPAQKSVEEGKKFEKRCRPIK